MKPQANQPVQLEKRSDEIASSSSLQKKTEHRRVCVEEFEEQKPEVPLIEEDLPDDFFEPDESGEDKKSKFAFIKELPDKKGIFKAAALLLKRLARGIFPEEFYFHARIGTGDPALTGYMCGLFGVLKMRFGSQLNVTGNFGELCFENAEMKVMGQIVPGYLLFAVLRFAFTKPVWRAIIAYWKGLR